MIALSYQNKRIKNLKNITMKNYHSIDKHPSLQIHYTTRSLDELENKDELKAALKKL